MAKTKKIIPHSSEAGKSKINMPANLVPGENPLPDFQRNTFFLYPHMVETEGGSKLSSIDSYKALIPSMKAPSS